MSAIDSEDLSIITGPLTVEGHPGVYLKPGEVVHAIELGESDTVLVYGYESDLEQWIDLSSLTPINDYYADTARWGDLIDPENIHDYVYEEDE
jgi:hypothetical protein